MPVYFVHKITTKGNIREFIEICGFEIADFEKSLDLICGRALGGRFDDFVGSFTGGKL